MNDPARSRSADFGCLSILVLVGAFGGLVAALFASRWLLAMFFAVLAAAALFAAYVLLQILPRRELERLAAGRAGYTRDDFLNHFQSMGLRREAVERAWEVLQGWLPGRGFPVLPEDELEGRLGITVHEEIDEILKDCFCREPADEEWEQANNLRTVEDFVVLVDHLYTGEPQEWTVWNQQPLTWRQRVIVALVALPIIAIPVVALYGYINWLMKHGDGLVFGVTGALVVAVAGTAVLIMRIATSRSGGT